MTRPDQEQGMRWRNLTLPLLLPAVAMLLLLFLMSSRTAGEPSVLLLQKSQNREGNHTLAHTSSAIIRPAVQDGEMWSANPSVKEQGNISRHVSLVNPLCTSCTLSPLESTPLTQTISPGDSAYYELRVENIGDCDGTLTLTPSSQRGWNVDVTTPSAPVSLQAGDWIAVTLTHTVPTCELSGRVDVATVTAVLDCNPQCDEFTRTTTLTTHVGQEIGVDLEPDLQRVATPGAVVLFTHTVTNTGNCTDITTFGVEQTLAWPTSPPSPVTLDPYSSTMVSLAVTVPLTARPGEVNAITLTAVSEADTRRTDHVVDRVQVKDDPIYLPFVICCDCPAIPLHNGDFETGDLSHWSRGGRLWSGIGRGLSGRYSALLGSPHYGCPAVPESSAWLEQSFSVPSCPPVCGHPHLFFRYEIHTQDSKKNDTFEVYLNGYPILKKGHTGPATKCNEDEKVISKTCSIDLANPTDCDGNAIDDANFLSSEITLRFENWNRNHTWYNTYTYVDDVKFTWHAYCPGIITR
jgi:hypothetical protein